MTKKQTKKYVHIYSNWEYENNNNSETRNMRLYNRSSKILPLKVGEAPDNKKGMALKTAKANIDNESKVDSAIHRVVWSER
jgi:hypothetical protein